MSEFTYELPFSNEKLLQGILIELKRTNKNEIIPSLKASKISIDDLGTSYYVDRSGRWNARGVKVKFYVNPNSIEALSKDEYRGIIFEICSNLIPGEVGYDIKEIAFVPDLNIDIDSHEDIIVELENQINESTSDILPRILPAEIRDKGREMAELYTFLYSIENSLRIFFEIVATEKYGTDYINKVSIPRSLEKTVSSRKESAANKKWLSIRGDSDLFYLDFKDIGTLINNNWTLFEKYFPNQNFILSKLDEMADIRNLIAHNSYVSKVERELVRTYYNSILKQIDSKF
ncbi:Swt1 family HEPN domain-containing protein [Paenibacillus sp. FSL M7-0802]|uniref:Swt1 family HEPN domain-containing protein n=1 Tax=Paenibacillus TaxID=44249 RepID=UPI00096E7123|nr:MULTISPECIES: Swt1 family HEPN domain-containing protein [Paenibacillus]OMF75787.1 hypothetical protein BK143_05340 [Paenibacillus peoriae]